MSAQHLSYITLDSCITDYMTEYELSQHKYFKLFHLAFRGLEDMGLDFFYRIQSVKLPINANYTVTLPANYLNWTKVGILNNRGEIIPLNYNEKFTTYADLLPNRVEKTQDPQTNILGWEQNLWCNYWNGNGYSNVYGIPSGQPFAGSFKVDTENGVILLNEKYHWDYLMLEYVCSPMEGQEYYLPMQFRESMISWLAWKDSTAAGARSHFNLGDKRDKERQYYNDRRKAIAKWKPIRAQEIYQSSQEMSRLAVKT